MGWENNKIKVILCKQLCFLLLSLNNTYYIVSISFKGLYLHHFNDCITFYIMYLPNPLMLGT